MFNTLFNHRYRLLLLGSLLLLLSSIGLNVRLIKRNYFLTQALTKTLLDPLGLHAFASESPPQENRNTVNVMFFGDSRAFSWPAPQMDDSFAFINRGIGGQTSAQTVERFDAHVTPLQPDVIIIQICVNELWRVPVFPDEKDEIVAACEEHISQIIEQSHDIGAEVVLTTVFPVKDPPITQRTYWSSDVYEAIDSVNEAIRFMAADEDVFVLDAYRLLADENGRLPEQYANDFLHINEAGYQVLNEALVDVLESTTAQ